MREREEPMEALDFIHGSCYRGEQKSAEPFLIDDLLDFSNEDAVAPANETIDFWTGNSTNSSTSTALESCNSSFSGSEPNIHGDLSCRSVTDSHFSDDLGVPYDDAAELEWLSNFVEESFSSEDFQKLQFLSGLKVQKEDEISQSRDLSDKDANGNEAVFRYDSSVPGKARSKRSRGAPCNWSSSLLVLSPTVTTSSLESTNSAEISIKKSIKSELKKKDPCDTRGRIRSEGRKCLHCAIEKTPQWRTGPLGPKTLCNACGVRYKSGRLVPEYRPAASPTFVLTKHSNCHRKVMELRRQNEHHSSKQQVQMQQQLLHQASVFDITEEYLIQHQRDRDFGCLI